MRKNIKGEKVTCAKCAACDYTQEVAFDGRPQFRCQNYKDMSWTCGYSGRKWLLYEHPIKLLTCKCKRQFFEYAYGSDKRRKQCITCEDNDRFPRY